MRVAVRCEAIVPGFSCGVENFTFALLNALARISDDELLVTIARGTRDLWTERVLTNSQLELREVLATASILGAPTTRRGRALSRGRRIMRASRFARRVVRPARIRIARHAAADFRPDITFHPFHMSDVSGVPSVVTVHDLRSHHPTFGSRLSRDVVKRNIERAQAIVTSWPHPYSEIRDRYPEAVDRLSMIPFPPMIAPLANGSRRLSGRPTLLYPSSTAAHKNHVALIDAIALVRQTVDVRLICTGGAVEPGYGAALERSRQVGVNDAVLFAGFVSAEEMDALFRSCDAVVAPTLWEAASGGVFEAFAYEKPVACSDIAPIRSQVELAGATVSFFDPHDPADIARAILATLQDRAVYTEGSRRGCAWLRRLSWDETARRYRELFQHVASTERRMIAA